MQRQAPAVLAPRTTGTHSANCALSVVIPQVQLLDKVVVPVVCNDRRSCSRQFRNPWRSCRCSVSDLLDKEVDMPVVVPGRCSGPDVQNQFVNKEVDMPAVVPHRSPGPASQKAVEVPLLQFFDKDSDMPVVVQRQAPVSTCGVPQLQFSVMPVEIPRCSSWTRLCSCAQPVETPQAQFFGFWGPVHRCGAGGPCHEDRCRVAQTPGSSLPLINCMRAWVWRKTHTHMLQQ